MRVATASAFVLPRTASVCAVANAPRHTPTSTSTSTTPAVDPAARVRASLLATGAALVRDHELRAAVDALFDVSAATLAPRHAGMRTEVVAAHGVDLEMFFAPQRNVGAAPAHDAASCPFCSPTGPSLSWRGRRIVPNAFPYAPASSQHLLLVPLDHKPQAFDRTFFTDALALQRWLGHDVALHFNGTAGNSQPHLHVHAHRERLPLERAIDDGSAQRAALGVVAGATVARIAHGPLRGVLLTGSDDVVVAAAARLATVLVDDDVVDGRYNLHILRRDNGAARLLFVPRRADSLFVDDAQAGKVGAGAFDVAGRHVVEGDQLEPAHRAAWTALLPRTIVDPNDIAGLAALLSTSPPTFKGASQVRMWQSLSA
jgi:hypothetical protein